MKSIKKQKKIINLGAPTSTSDAATKGYVDSAVFTGDMQGNAIVNLKNPVNSQDAATKDFVEKSHVSQSGATTKCISVSDVRCERKFFRVKYHCDRNQQLFQTLRTQFSKKLTSLQLGKMHKTSTMQELGLTFSEFPQERILTWLSIFRII